MLQNLSVIDDFKNGSEFCTYNSHKYGVPLDYIVNKKPCFVEVVGVPKEDLFNNSAIRKSLRLDFFHSHLETAKNGQLYRILHTEFNKESKNKMLSKYEEKYGKPDSVNVVEQGFDFATSINFREYFWNKMDYQIVLFVSEHRYTAAILNANPEIVNDLVQKDYCSYDFICEPNAQKMSEIDYFNIIARYKLHPIIEQGLEKKFEMEYKETDKSIKQSKF